jgi:TRAP-type uncharacterized transport system substrate-binding protein
LNEAEKANDGVVSLISGTPGGTYFKMASDLSFVLDGQNGIRILPIMGKGAGQNAYDIMYLKGIDVGFVRTDTLEQLKADPKIKNPTSQVVYIARLFNDELHILASKDVTDVKQLAGKKVSFDVAGSGSDYSGKAMFQGLGIQVNPVNIDQASAVEALKRGDLDAVVSVAAKPVAFLQNLPKNDRFHLLNVPFPSKLVDTYLPADLETADYPNLVVAGETVRTLAVGTILAAFNHQRDTERYQRLARFTDAFFSNFHDLLRAPRHPKWQEVDIRAVVPGWIRFQPAQDWLDRTAREVSAKEASQQAAARAEVQKFLESKVLSLDVGRDKLLSEFLTWRAARGK